MVSCLAGRFSQTFRSARHNVMTDCRRACAMVFDAIAKAVTPADKIDPRGVGPDFQMEMIKLEEASNKVMPLC